MSRFSRKRKIEGVPRLGARVVATIARALGAIAGFLTALGIGDIIKHWLGGRALDFLFEHLGVIGLFLITYKFAFLTLGVILVLLWVAWEVIQQATISEESLVDNLEGGKYTYTRVSRPWAAGFCIGLLLCIALVGYGAWDYSKSSALLREFPLGYVVLRTDTITGAVMPLEMRRGLEAYTYDFRPVRVLENDAQVRLTLPDVFKAHQLIMRGAQIGGDRATMQEHGAGYLFSACWHTKEAISCG